jgi:hypothetical protein
VHIVQAGVKQLELFLAAMNVLPAQRNASYSEWLALGERS